MEESIKEVLARFKITEDECETVTIPVETKEVDQLDKKWCLVGELMINRRFNREAFRKAMIQTWQTRGVKFIEIEENVFLFCFADAASMLYVQRQGPWLFEDCLLVLTKWNPSIKTKMDIPKKCEFWTQIHGLPYDCRGRETTRVVVEKIGRVTDEEGDVESQGVQQRKFLRFKIELDITKPMVWGLIVVNEGVKKWVWFKYERLPKFCSKCGRMGHTFHWCSSRVEAETQEGQSQPVFGEWLRAGPPIRKQQDDRSKPWRRDDRKLDRGKENRSPIPEMEQKDSVEVVGENLGEVGQNLGDPSSDSPSVTGMNDIQKMGVDLAAVSCLDMQDQIGPVQGSVQPKENKRKESPLKEKNQVQEEGPSVGVPAERSKPMSLIGLKRKCRAESKKRVEVGESGPVKRLRRQEEGSEGLRETSLNGSPRHP